MGRDVPVSRPVFAALLALLLVACGWRGPKDLQTWPGVKNGGAMIALDKAAHKLVAVQDRTVEAGADGRLHVRLELANLSDKDLTVQVQTIFRDDGGALLDDSTPFEAIVLPGNGSKLYERTSLSPKAASFLVQVKTP